MALKSALLQEHMLSQNSAKASATRATQYAEQLSVKQTTNKDMFFPFAIEAVSDAFLSVQLKK